MQKSRIRISRSRQRIYTGTSRRLHHASAPCSGTQPLRPLHCRCARRVTIQLSRDSAVIEKAYRALARRFEAEPSERAYYIPYAQAAEYLGRNDDRIHIWETLDRLLPDRTDPAMQLAEAMTARYAVTVDTADFNRAMRIYDRIEAATGPTPELTARKINALMQRNDTTSVMRSLGTVGAHHGRFAHQPLHRTCLRND